jgi:hypothetical protein
LRAIALAGMPTMSRIDLDILPPTSVGQGMTTEAEGLVLQLLRALRDDLAKLDAKLGRNLIRVEV